MAVGDAAAAAGLPVVPSTKDLRLGYGDINALADALAVREAALSIRLATLEAANNWVSYTPTLTDFVLGSGGTMAAEYKVAGKLVHVRARFRFGTGPSVSNPKLSLPVAMASPPTPSNAFEMLGMGTLYSGGVAPVAVLRSSTSLTVAALYRWGDTGSGFANWIGASPTAPAATDSLSLEFTYRGA